MISRHNIWEHWLVDYFSGELLRIREGRVWKWLKVQVAQRAADMTVNQRQKHGFTLIEIMIVCAIIGLLAVIAIPNYVTARVVSQRRTCIYNLRQIDSAKQQWALEQGKSAADPAPAGSEIQSYIGRGASGSLSSVICPSGDGATFDTSYSIGDISTPPVCQIVGLAQQSDASKAHVLP